MIKPILLFYVSQFVLWNTGDSTFHWQSKKLIVFFSKIGLGRRKFCIEATRIPQGSLATCDDGPNFVESLWAENFALSFLPIIMLCL